MFSSDFSDTSVPALAQRLLLTSGPRRSQVRMRTECFDHVVNPSVERQGNAANPARPEAPALAVETCRLPHRNARCTAPERNACVSVCSG